MFTLKRILIEWEFYFRLEQWIMIIEKSSLELSKQNVVNVSKFSKWGFKKSQKLTTKIIPTE